MEAPPIQRVDRTWDVIAHLSALLMFTAIPFGNILGPLIVWLIKRNDSPTVAEHAKESLNFQLSLTLYYIVAIGVSVLLMFVIIGFLLLPIAIGAGILGMIFDVILIIMAAVRAGNGEMYRYPITIRFVS
jgi:uncharacterized Tic20 family protein